jgi:hypothetical protein
MPPWFWGGRLASHPPRVESWPAVTEMKQPNVYIVAGPNGAGKSTFARLFLPDYADCREFVNADLIAAGLSPLKAIGRTFSSCGFLPQSWPWKEFAIASWRAGTPFLRRQSGVGLQEGCPTFSISISLSSIRA